MVQHDELQIIEHIKRGGFYREKAIKSLYARYCRPLISFAFKLGMTYQGAEELAHDVLLRFLDRIDKFNPRNKNSISSYLFTSVKNKVYDVLESKSKTPIETPIGDIPSHNEVFTVEGDDVFEIRKKHNNTNVEELRSIFANFSDKEKYLIDMYLNNLTYKDMSEYLNIEVKHIGVYLNRALNKLELVSGVVGLKDRLQKQRRKHNER